jgi:hypothetical protein
MKSNESTPDRIFRAVIGIILLALYITSTVTGVIGILLAVVGAIALVTGVVGFCPLYALLKIKTLKS